MPIRPGVSLLLVCLCCSADKWWTYVMAVRNTCSVHGVWSPSKWAHWQNWVSHFNAGCLDTQQRDYSSARRSTTTSSTCCGIAFTGLASRPTARPVRVVSADVQGAPWSGIAVYRRSLPASYISWQQTETPIRHSRGVGVSSSARTSAPVHSLWRAQRHGTSCRRIYEH